MPLRTKYEIYGRLLAPVVSTYDKITARIEFNNYLRNPQQGLHRLVQTVEPVGELTKEEEYLYLVWRVRRVWKRYKNEGRKPEDKDEAMKLDGELDAWNMRNRIYIESHPGYEPASKESYDFFLTVLEWRDVWKNRRRRSGAFGSDPQLAKEISQDCRNLEKRIDQYLKKKLNLI